MYLDDIHEVVLRVLWNDYKEVGVRISNPDFMIHGSQIVKACMQKEPNRSQGADKLAALTHDEPAPVAGALRELRNREILDFRSEGAFAEWQVQLTPNGIDTCAELFAALPKKLWKWVGQDVRTVVVAVIAGFIAALIASYLYPLLRIGNR